MTDMLVAVIEEGTGRRARVLNRIVGGKTGTTDQYRDALFIGFSPSISVGVWVGQDRYETLGDKETGAKAALPIWIEFMRNALAQSALEYFDLPDDVMRVRIDPVTGALAADGSPNSVPAIFKRGTIPSP
jgi:penicillin-binding protein 1A